MEISEDRLHELVFQAAGAATRPLMQDHPTYVFPSERVKEAVEDVLRDFDVTTMPAMLSVDAIKAHLDASIEHWRGVRDGTQAPPATLADHERPYVESIATCYVDAYQSARVSLVGDQLDP